MQKLKKPIFILLILIITTAILEIFSFAIVKTYRYLNNIPNYTGVSIAHDIIEKEKKYYAFYTWRDNYSDTNIYGSRQTTINPNWNKKNYIYFFGGSTMIGSGVGFNESIPSHAANLGHSYQPVNLGDHGYVSGQSLNRLIEIIDDVKKGDIVVFYDGNNDTLSNCNTLNGPNGHGEVGHFRELLKDEKQLIKLKFNYLKIQDFIYTSNTFAVINGVFKRFFSLNLLNLREPDQLRTTNFGCDKEEYAFAVAKNVVRHWKVAETIVKDKNAKFICVLQPTPYTSTFKVNQPVRLLWKRSIEKVYPAIKKFSKNLDCFNDLSEVLDRDYYIDNCCHLNSEGNKVIANEIMKVVRGRLETP